MKGRAFFSRASMVCPQRVGVKCTRYPPSCATFPAAVAGATITAEGYPRAFGGGLVLVVLLILWAIGAFRGVG
jgi:hypothetical protein